MVTMAQRIEQLRTQRGLSRPQLSAALGLAKNAAEKFETGRQTPTQEQQNRLADFFGVSLLYLQGKDSDPTRQDSWMDGGIPADWAEDDVSPAPGRKTSASCASAQPKAHAQNAQEGGPVLDALLRSKAFQDALHAAVLDVLRSREGQDILAQALTRQQRK